MAKNMISDVKALHRTYDDVEKLLFSTVHAFRARFGGDFDELMGDAYVAFREAYDTYESGRSLFSARVRFIVWNRLLSNLRQRLKRLESHVNHHELHEDLPVRERFDLQRFRRELSNDARTVLRLVLEHEDRPVPTVRKLVASTLEDMGWTARQIADTFWEITRALP